MNIAGFRKLQIWQKAMELTEDIYKMTEQLPETVTQVSLCTLLGYFNQEQQNHIDNQAETIDRMTISFIN